jgi:hypothetical protein
MHVLCGMFGKVASVQQAWLPMSRLKGCRTRLLLRQRQHVARRLQSVNCHVGNLAYAGAAGHTTPKHMLPCMYMQCDTAQGATARAICCNTCNCTAASLGTADYKLDQWHASSSARRTLLHCEVSCAVLAVPTACQQCRPHTSASCRCSYQMAAQRLTPNDHQPWCAAAAAAAIMRTE